ncbi:protein YLS3-like [Populus alba x Populus x berolinensis]|nr:protein YLS3-like [Populus alba x Populus x berolinensis]
MGSKNGVTASAISYILVLLMLVGSAKSDFQQDRAECADQLVGLSTCLPYVSGDSKAPTLDCCSGLKQVLDKSKKCLCVLIKDRDNPNLGIKFNVTLVGKLPSLCHSPVNVTECIDLLHLPANSTDAKFFEGFANITQSGSIETPAGSGSSNGSNPSSAAVKSSDERPANRWLVAEIVCGSLLLAFTSLGF